MANLIDAVQIDTWAFIKANSKKSPKKPEPFERPTTKKKVGKDPSNNMFMAMARATFNKSRKGADDRTGR